VPLFATGKYARHDRAAVVSSLSSIQRFAYKAALDKLNSKVQS
jgi:hypothetical protein